MPQLHQDDLFEDTKMSFGEHLEELRVCLVRALIGLAIGFLFGLLIADDVVRHIEGPLQQALDKFYREKTESELRERYPQLDEAVVTFMQDQGFVFEEVYWEAREIERILRDLGRLEKQSAGENETQSPTASGQQLD